MSDLRWWIVSGSYAETLVLAPTKDRAEQVARDSKWGFAFAEFCYAEETEAPDLTREGVIHGFAE